MHCTFELPIGAIVTVDALSSKHSGEENPTRKLVHLGGGRMASVGKFPVLMEVLPLTDGSGGMEVTTRVPAKLSAGDAATLLPRPFIAIFDFDEQAIERDYETLPDFKREVDELNAVAMNDSELARLRQWRDDFKGSLAAKPDGE